MSLIGAAVAAAVALIAVPSTSADRSRPTDRCRTAGRTEQANGVARLYSTRLNGDVHYHGCVYNQRRNLGDFAVRGRTRGATGVSLQGYFLGSVVHGLDCGRGDCRPDEVWVYDLRRPDAAARIPGGSFVLRADGSFAVITNRDAEGNSQVVVLDARGLHILDQGDIAPESLALAGHTLYWTHDAQARSGTM